MGFFSRFKRKPKTFSASSSRYKNLKPFARRPFQPKSSSGGPSRMRGFKEKFLLGLKLGGSGALILLGLYGAFFTSLFTIQKVDVTGGQDTVSEQSAVNTLLQKYLGKNLLLFKTKELEDELHSHYPYLKTLKVGRDFFHTVTVLMESYPSVANIRMELGDGSEQIFTINELGFISGIGSLDDQLTTIVMDISGTEATLPIADPTEEGEIPSPPTWEVNQELIPEDILADLLNVKKEFEGRIDMQVLEVRYLKQAREVHLKTERDFTVWIDLTQDIDLQLTKLKKATSVLNIYEANLEYVDLRISGQNGEKVIYKLSNE